MVLMDAIDDILKTKRKCGQRKWNAYLVTMLWIIMSKMTWNWWIYNWIWSRQEVQQNICGDVLRIFQEDNMIAKNILPFISAIFVAWFVLIA